jgi:hypothetical protein
VRWCEHPLFWLGIVGATAVGYVLLRRRRQILGDLGAAPPRGGIFLPPGLLARRFPGRTTSKRTEEPLELPDQEPEVEDEELLEAEDWELPELPAANGTFRKA